MHFLEVAYFFAYSPMNAKNRFANNRSYWESVSQISKIVIDFLEVSFNTYWILVKRKFRAHIHHKSHSSYLFALPHDFLVRGIYTLGI